MTKLPLLPISLLALSGMSAQASLVAHFDFEEGSGTTTASQVGGWTGPFSGDPQWVSTSLAPVPSGTTAALAFDGLGDWIVSDYAGIGGSGDRSVSFWVSSTNATQNTGIVAWGDSSIPNGRKWHVRLNNSAGNGPTGAIRTEIQGSYEIDGSPLTDGNWHHVVSTYSSGGPFGSGQVSHYVDGILISDGQTDTGGDTTVVNTVTSPTISGSTYPVLLGGRHQGTVVSFDGLLDEVRIYDHALSASEVQGLYQVPEPATGLLAGLAIGFGATRRCRR
ncbi:PEP-CTERM sorting domain-containing protein [Akkermansiaceae bacterium]|nr:PEP-CTERM sorting domain-containing protein [Akkermansiaceae bacterium]MDA7888393.1 PEP-CTERM sorting domain-containing protein [Akkermansiaceae bacterium]